MSDEQIIYIDWTEGSTEPIHINCGKWSDTLQSFVYGTENGLNLTDPTKDIYVQFFDFESNTATPKVQKSRVANVLNGMIVDEDQSSKTKIVVNMVAADYTTMNTNGYNAHMYELRAKFKQNMYNQETPLIPYREERSGRLVRVVFVLHPKKISA